MLLLLLTSMVVHTNTWNFQTIWNQRDAAIATDYDASH